MDQQQPGADAAGPRRRAAFRHLTEQEARTLPRRELLDRVEAEMQWWTKARCAADWDGFMAFSRIMHANLDPGAMIRDTIGLLEGAPGGGEYMERSTADDEQEAGLSREERWDRGFARRAAAYGDDPEIAERRYIAALTRRGLGLPEAPPPAET